MPMSSVTHEHVITYDMLQFLPQKLDPLPEMAPSWGHLTTSIQWSLCLYGIPTVLL